ncbi:MAG: hypothetical protein FJ292_02300 [Planctomycetes bacterium]|nr:hypothetical protein [Planctomycetota bacterium]
MAKLFYTLQETLTKLGKDQEAVDGLVSAGKLREFRDHDNKLMFKREEVDLLLADAAGSGELDLSGVSAGSDSFELDLSDSSVDDRGGTGRSASPVGLGGVEDKTDDSPFELDLAESAAGAAPASGGAGDLDLDLDLDSPKAGSAPAFDLDLDDADGAGKSAGKAASASMSGIASPAAHDDLTLELDLGDGGNASNPGDKAASASMSGITTPAAREDMTLELDLGDDAPSPAAKAPSRPMADSVGSVAAASAAGASGSQLGLDGSNTGAAPDGSSISDRIGLDGVSSGSGLMDLTNDSESSSIGAALMDEAFSSDEGAELPANASGIFGGESGEGGESGAGLAAAAVGVAAGVVATTGKKGAAAAIFTSGPAAPEVYSGPWSGLGVGLLLPASLGLIATAAIVVSKQLGAPPELAVMYASDWVMYTGAFAGIIAVSGAIGFFVGKATE